jgi:hypothetical protein
VRDINRLQVFETSRRTAGNCFDDQSALFGNHTATELHEVKYFSTVTVLLAWILLNCSYVGPFVMSIEQQQDELLERIRDFDAEVSAIIGPVSREQAAVLRKRYRALAVEIECLQELRLALN